MAKATTTVKIDEQGRCYLPKVVREKLGIDGEEAIVGLEIEYEGGDD